MQYLNNKELKQATIDVIKNKPRLAFEYISNDKELKNGLYIIIYNDSQSVAYNLFAYKDALIDLVVFLIFLLAIFSLLFIIA